MSVLIVYKFIYMQRRSDQIFYLNNYVYEYVVDQIGILVDPESAKVRLES